MRYTPPTSLLALMIALFAAPLAAPAQTNAAYAIYDPDPNHLWNRLFVAFYHQTYNVPTNSNETSLWAGPDVLDPPISRHPRFMLDDAPFARCNAVLDEFLVQHGAKLIRDPLKRAMLQRDFWSVFDVLANTFQAPSLFGAGPSFSTKLPALPEAFEGRRVLLAHKVARILNSLALTRAEIERLPDTYQAAVDSRMFSTIPDPERDDVLPDDLFSSGTRWVEFVPARGEGRLNHSAMISGRSLFRVFVKLPPGSRGDIGPPKPAPVGTQFLLMREMICLDEHWQMVPTHVVESVQFRTSVKGSFSVHALFREMQLSRTRLFNGRQGGLRSESAGELDVIGYGSLGHFNLVDERGNAGRVAALSIRCGGCHEANQGRKLISGGTVAVPRRSPDINAVILWRKQRAPLDNLREFIARAETSR